MTGGPSSNSTDPKKFTALEYDSLREKLCTFKEHERLQNAKSAEYNNPDKAASMAGIKFLTKEQAEAEAAADTPKSTDSRKAEAAKGEGFAEICEKVKSN